MAGDGMIEKVVYPKRGDLSSSRHRAAEVRASVVAVMRRNGRGAKGGRKVDA